MTLSPLDIRNKSFSVKMRGFSTDEVDDFLDQVINDYEEVIRNNRDLEKSLKHADEKLAYFNELKDALNQSIIVAQDTADKMKDSATKESELIISTAEAQAKETVTEATNKANDILNDATARARELAVETDDLKKKTRSFHQKLSLLIQSQMDLVNNSEWDEILKPFSAYVNDHHEHVREILDEETLEKTEETENDSADVKIEEDHQIVFDDEEGTKEAVDPETTSILFPDTDTITYGDKGKTE